MSIEDEIKAEARRVREGEYAGVRPNPGGKDVVFAEIRAEVQGALMRAWARLVPTGEWLQVDDRLRDIVDEWLKQKRGGSQ